MSSAGRLNLFTEYAAQAGQAAGAIDYAFVLEDGFAIAVVEVSLS